MFDRGATTGEHAPNWVTMWLLYSVFRSRDVRNNRNRRTGEGSGGSGGKIGTSREVNSMLISCRVEGGQQNVRCGAKPISLGTGSQIMSVALLWVSYGS
jgi:hypothetical protein